MSEQPMVSLATYVEVVGSLEARIADLQRDCDTYFGDAAAAHVRLEEVERELERFKHLWSVARTRADTAERALDAERERANELQRASIAQTEVRYLFQQQHLTDIAELATERQARQQAEGTAEDYRLEREAYRKSYEEAVARAQQAEGERDEGRRGLRIAAKLAWGYWKYRYDLCESFADGYLSELEAAEARLADAVGLLRRMHDKMDDYNASRAIAGCRWCHIFGYDATGLLHGIDCPLVDARAFLARVDASAEEPAAGDDGR